MDPRRKLLVLFMFFLYCQVAHGSAVRIQISPAKWTGMKLEPANVKCLLDQIDRDAMFIYSIRIEGPNNQLIANITNNNVISYGPNVDTTNIKVKGIIDQVDKSKSYLSLDLLVLLKRTYTCDVLYYDKNWFQKIGTKSDSLIEEQDVESILLSLISRISTIENKKKGYNKQLTELKKKNNVLEEGYQKLREELKEFRQEQNKMGQVVAFKAYDPTDIKYGDKLLFRDVDPNFGNGYNKTAGIFTAPQAGLYVFTLTVATRTKGDRVNVIISAASRAVGWLHVKDGDTMDQSSTSVPVPLSQGDRVYPYVVATNTDTLGGSHYSVFTGHLVHGM